MSCFKLSFHRKWISLLVAWPGVDKKQEGSSAHTQTSQHGTCSCSCKFCLFFASPQISLQKDNCSLSDAASSKTFSLFPFCSNWPELIRVLVFLTPRFLLNYSQIQLKVFPTTLVYLLHFRSLPVLSDINSNSVIQYSIAGNFLWFLGPSLIAI